MAEGDDEDVKLALLAHDLRTPLSAMRLTAELIGNGPLNRVQAEQLSILIKSIDVLTDMTGELLEAVGTDHETEKAWQRVADVVAACTDLFQVAADVKNLKLDLKIANNMGNLATYQGAELRRVLTALLDNAVKYTKEGSIRVDVAQERRAGEAGAKDTERSWVRVSVSDTGPGIDAEDKAQLFRPYARGRHGLETGPGTGLGLWGAAQQVQEMRGQLELVQPESGGSRFDVRFPAQEKETPALESESDGEPASGSVSDVLQAHILIVDDNETNCRLLAALLESFGLTYEVAKSGPEALARVTDNAFDAVLLDLHMPGMGGVETAEALRRVRPDASPPLIAVTAALESVGEKRLQDAGFCEVVVKPLSPAVLYATLERVLQPRGGESGPAA